MEELEFIEELDIVEESEVAKDELRSMFHAAIDGVDPIQLAGFIDYYLEWYMSRENIKEITKMKGDYMLRRAYD